MRGGGEPGIRVRCLAIRVRCPVFPFPVDEVVRRVAIKSFPPDISVVGQCHIGENGVGSN